MSDKVEEWAVKHLPDWGTVDEATKAKARPLIAEDLANRWASINLPDWNDVDKETKIKARNTFYQQNGINHREEVPSSTWAHIMKNIDKFGDTPYPALESTNADDQVNMPDSEFKKRVEKQSAWEDSNVFQRMDYTARRMTAGLIRNLPVIAIPEAIRTVLNADEQGYSGENNEPGRVSMVGDMIHSMLNVVADLGLQIEDIGGRLQDFGESKGIMPVTGVGLATEFLGSVLDVGLNSGQKIYDAKTALEKTLKDTNFGTDRHALQRGFKEGLSNVEFTEKQRSDFLSRFKNNYDGLADKNKREAVQRGLDDPSAPVMGAASLALPLKNVGKAVGLSRYGIATKAKGLASKGSLLDQVLGMEKLYEKTTTKKLPDWTYKDRVRVIAKAQKAGKALDDIDLIKERNPGRTPLGEDIVKNNNHATETTFKPKESAPKPKGKSPEPDIPKKDPVPNPNEIIERDGRGGFRKSRLQDASKVLKAKAENLGVPYDDLIRVGKITGGIGTIAYLMSDEDDGFKEVSMATLVGLIGSVGTSESVMRKLSPFARAAKKLNRTNSPIAQEVLEKAARIAVGGRKMKANLFSDFEDVLREQYGSGVFSKLRRMPEYWKDSKWLADNAKEAIEHPDKLKAPNPRVKAVLAEWDKVARMLGTEFEAVGHQIFNGKKMVPFRMNKHYFPNVLTTTAKEALEAKQGAVYDELARVAKTKGINIDDFTSILTEKMTVKKFGSVDFARMAELPNEITVGGKTIKVLETDLFKILPKHIENATRRLAVIKTLGKDPTKVAREFHQKIKDVEGGQAAKAWKDMWADLNGFPVDKFDRGYLPFKIGNSMLQLVRSGQLTLASLSNVGGYYPIAVRHGLTNTAKAFFNSFRSPEKVPELAEARRLGGWSWDTIGDLYMTEDFSGPAGKISSGILKATGMNVINRHINKTASLAAMYDLDRGLSIIRAGQSGKFKAMWGLTEKEYRAQLKDQFYWGDKDINRMVEKGPTSDDLARVAQMTPEAVNLYQESGLTRPRWMSHYASRQFLAYTGFVRAFGNVAMDAMSAARRGNVRPLTNLLIGGAASGETIIALKSWFADKEREDANIYSRLFHDLAYAGSLGLMGELAQRTEFAVKFGESWVDLTPPQVRPFASLTELIYVINGDKDLSEVLNKETQRAVPLYKALYRTINKFSDDQLAYVAERVKGGMYMSSGISSEGDRYRRGDPIPNKYPNTVESLLKRVGGQKKVRHYLRRQNKADRKEQKRESRRKYNEKRGR